VLKPTITVWSSQTSGASWELLVLLILFIIIRTTHKTGVHVVHEKYTKKNRKAEKIIANSEKKQKASLSQGIRYQVEHNRIQILH